MAVPSLRVRFVFNQKAGDTSAQTATTKKGRDFAATLVENLTFSAADAEYKNVVVRIQNSFQRDAKQELVHLMALFRRHIIGAAAGSNKPGGTLTFALGPSETDVGFDDDNFDIAQSLPAWAPRGAKYLKWKRKHGLSQTWFKARGVLDKQARAETMLESFGPIRVSVIRNLKAAPARSFHAGGDVHSRINIATVRVFAMANITPAMLPALRTGSPTAMNSDRGNPGLMGLLSRTAPDLAYRLGRRSGMESGKRYRPTLEPFLAFYLTRSLPNALALRLQNRRLRGY